MYSLITGGSSGLGLSIAKELVKRGKSIIITGRNRDKLEKAYKELLIIDKSCDVRAHSVELSDSHGIKMLFASLHEDDITIDHIYNVAGSGFYGSLVDIEKDDIIKVINNNMISVMLTTIEGIKYFSMHPSNRHKIISVLSTAALKGKGMESIYNASKFGAKGFLLSVEDEVKEKNIDIVRVYPGGMNTPFWEDSQSGYPVNTFMSSDDVAAQIVEAVSNDLICVSDLTINRPKG